MELSCFSLALLEDSDWSLGSYVRMKRNSDVSLELQPSHERTCLALEYIKPMSWTWWFLSLGFL